MNTLKQECKPMGFVQGNYQQAQSSDEVMTYQYPHQQVQPLLFSQSLNSPNSTQNSQQNEKSGIFNSTLKLQRHIVSCAANMLQLNIDYLCNHNVPRGYCSVDLKVSFCETLYVLRCISLEVINQTKIAKFRLAKMYELQAFIANTPLRWGCIKIKKVNF